MQDWMWNRWQYVTKNSIVGNAPLPLLQALCLSFYRHRCHCVQNSFPGLGVKLPAREKVARYFTRGVVKTLLFSSDSTKCRLVRAHECQVIHQETIMLYYDVHPHDRVPYTVYGELVNGEWKDTPSESATRKNLCWIEFFSFLYVYSLRMLRL